MSNNMENLLIFLVAAGAIGGLGFVVFKKRDTFLGDTLPPLPTQKPLQQAPDGIVDALNNAFDPVFRFPSDWAVPFFNSNTPQSYSRAKVLSEIRASKIAKEGFRNIVYLDTLELPTVGIGHLVVPEDNLRLGDTISNARVEQLFAQDSNIALNAAENQARELNALNNDFVLALSHVNFQLGTAWKYEHSKTWDYLMAGNYDAAAIEVKDSIWYSQTPVRVIDFSNAIIRLKQYKQRNGVT